MSIYETTDYKTFLKESIRLLPQNGRGEVGRMANRLRVNSTLISQVLHGNKNFTLEQAYELAEYLGLSRHESLYFLEMVELARAGTAKLRAFRQARLEELRKEALSLSHRVEKDRTLNETEKAIFYSSHIYSAIRLETSLGNGSTLDSISRRFNVSRARASEILQFLVEANLCVKEGDKFRVGPQRTHLESSSPFVARHHLNWRLEGMKRAERLTEEELMFTAPFTISPEDFLSIRERLVGLIKEVADKVQGTSPQFTACLNMDLFKL